MSLEDRFKSADTGTIEGESWNDRFSSVVVGSEEASGRAQLSIEEASSDRNKYKNRYTDVLPYDQNRVLLSDKFGKNYDYINASPIVIPAAKRRYILTQGPLAHTCDDFWQMVWENNVPAIIMLNKLVEAERKKCAQYYPSRSDGEHRECDEYENFKVELVDETNNDDYTARHLLLSCPKSNDEPRTVLHVTFTEWPDFGIPSSTESFLKFFNYIQDAHVLGEDEKSPPCIVHCSAGIGRSGTFIVAETALRMIDFGMKEEDMDVEKVVIDLRMQRSGLIQTSPQLRFCWQIIVDCLKNKSTEPAELPVTSPSSSKQDNERKRVDEERDSDEVQKKRRKCEMVVDGSSSL